MDLVEGWTENLDFVLYINKPPVTFDANGMTPFIEVFDKTGAQVTMSGAVSWLDAAHSTVRYSPVGTEFDADLSPYTVRVKVQASGRYAWWPNAQAVPLIVRK